jgi:ribosomal protein S18 acetylase RimI-like enzyme
MTTELITPSPDHAPELGRICFEAFRDVDDRHGFPRDFPDVEIAIKVITMMSASKDVFGVAAHTNGTLVGSNFLLRTDAVGGVGPITIDPAYQGKGVGRQLMKAVLDEATARGMEQVRLTQDSFNTASLSLYASLGFNVVEPIGVMRAASATKIDATVRPVEPADLPFLAELSERRYRTNRGRELNHWREHGTPILVREAGGRIRGYLALGMVGHGVAETNADALVLISQISRYAHPGTDLFFLPLRDGDLYRAVLSCGCRLIKVMNLMALGRYAPPQHPWMPSIIY